MRLCRGLHKSASSDAVLTDTYKSLVGFDFVSIYMGEGHWKALKRYCFIASTSLIQSTRSRSKNYCIIHWISKNLLRLETGFLSFIFIISIVLQLLFFIYTLHFKCWNIKFLYTADASKIVTANISLAVKDNYFATQYTVPTSSFLMRHSSYSTSTERRSRGLSLKLVIRNLIVSHDAIMPGVLSCVSFSGLRRSRGSKKGRST